MSNRSEGVAKVAKQFREAPVITQDALDDLVAKMIERKETQLSIDALRAVVEVGKTKSISFIGYKGYQSKILRIFAASLQEAVDKLDDYGKFIKQDEFSHLPNLHAWAEHGSAKV